MSINRVPSVPFAQIANSALRDSRLSFKARGLLAMVLSNVGEWEATAEWIERQSEPDGKHAIQTALNELSRYGYRVVRRERRPNGQVFTVVDWFHESQESRSPENPVAGLPDGRGTGSSIEHYPSEHHQEEHHETRTPVRKPVNLDDDPLFAEFWATYPRREGKGAARSAWLRAIRKTDPATIIAGAARYRDDKNRVQAYTAHPGTWLNGERWDDEPLPANDNQEPARPVTYMDEVTDEPCEHGDPRGSVKCALCRAGA